MPESETPLVTIIMPIRNETYFIARSLEAVLTQDYPHEQIEILISDGMSTDTTRAEIEMMRAKHPDIKLKVLDNEKQIVSAGLNFALKQANGKIIIRVDGHTIVAPNYVTECVRTLRESGADNVGGRMKAVGESVLGIAIAEATSSFFGVGGARFHFSDKEELVDTVYLGAWFRDTFDRIGLFDEEMVRNQDDEFNYRLRECGGKILLTHKIVSHYYNRDTLTRLWRQYYQYGYWKVRVLQKHRRQMRVRQFVPGAFVCALILGLLLALLIQPFRLFWYMLVGLYVLANLFVSYRIALRLGWKSFLRLPIIFLTMHLSYGAGFWAGLYRFKNRWWTDA